jgi:hypothetical protein
MTPSGKRPFRQFSKSRSLSTGSMILSAATKRSLDNLHSRSISTGSSVKCFSSLPLLFFAAVTYSIFVLSNSLTIKTYKMEKLRFTIRFIITLAALPVIMFTELTRQDHEISQQKQQTAKEILKKDDVAMVNYHSPFLQAIL